MSINRHSEELVVPDDRFENPGLPPHHVRMSDRDPKAAKRAERQVTGILLVSILASIGGIVGFAIIPVGTNFMDVRLSTLALGLGLGIGMLGIGVAAVHWAKALMSVEESIEQRKPVASPPEVREDAVTMLEDGAAEANVARRPVLKGALAGAVALAPLPFVVPLVGGLSDTWDVGRFRQTAWGDIPTGTGGAIDGGGTGRRLATDPDDRPIRAADVTLGSAFQVIPHGLPDQEHYLEEKAKAVVFMTRIDPAVLNISPERREWSYDGIVAFSKICTHVGCPVALYEQQTHHLLCPCHQSTFDLADEAKVVFGPAKRALPQLPITVDTEGYLVAREDFHEPIGASFWERAR
ncbi:cytochrome bc1 complex Rieske iron-sulfur subunit [Georgenia sunbinii]|uniref:cytochrome bc1 complex Rieske iron-sulfur subunit n=1 Tax=Georgenia sunbinii TaxID=3117728 RepID=UPI002F263F46